MKKRERRKRRRVGPWALPIPGRSLFFSLVLTNWGLGAVHFKDWKISVSVDLNRKFVCFPHGLRASSAFGGVARSLSWAAQKGYVSPLARAFSGDSLPSPDTESLLAVSYFSSSFYSSAIFIRSGQFLTFGQFPGTSWPRPNPRQPFRSVLIQEIIFLLCFKIPVAINILLLRCKIFI